MHEFLDIFLHDKLFTINFFLVIDIQFINNNKENIYILFKRKIFFLLFFYR